jgi:Fe2+ transport system protein FeoA
MITALNVEKGFRSEKAGCLRRFPCGVQGTIIDMNGDAELQGCLMGMGLFIGTRFQLLQGNETSTVPFLLAIGETRIALGHEIAEMILVER